jgi:hypothetical protein
MFRIVECDALTQGTPETLITPCCPQQRASTFKNIPRLILKIGMNAIMPG